MASHQWRTTSIFTNRRENTSLFPLIACFLTATNGMATIIRAFGGGNHSVFAFMFFAYFDLVLLHFCVSEYQRLPPHEKSLRKGLLKHSIWLLFSSVTLGFTYKFAPFLGFAVAIPLYVIAVAGSALVFYAYVIHDGENAGCSDGGSDEEEFFFWNSSCVGRVNEAEMEYFDFVLEKV